jgi:acetyl-CoA synthetase
MNVESSTHRCSSNERAEAFLAARELLLRLQEDYSAAYQKFRWADPSPFNWALDHFDVLARNSSSVALQIVDSDGRERACTFEDQRRASNQAAQFWVSKSTCSGDQLIVASPNCELLALDFPECRESRPRKFARS